MRHRLDGENIDWRDEGDAVWIGAWEEDAVVGGDGGVCWSKVRGDEKQLGIGGRRTGASLLSWMWW